jgi:hypothetical protein
VPAVGSPVRPAGSETAPASPDTTDVGGESAAESGPALSLPVGTTLAHFRIDAPIGRGGMGEVYRATDVALDRPVALKVLPADVAGDPRRRERMIREARAQADVVHPHVCHIYYVGEERGLLFFAMELIRGETLSERIARGPLAPNDALEIIRAAALGLRAAHAQGYTHRDVKPSNLMIDGAGHVKLLDFGLVVRSARAAGDDLAATTMAGTPLYMAPEQARGEPVDHRADIYALGATLYQLVAGRPPFAGADAASLRVQHEDAPRPSLARPTIRGGPLPLVDAVCARMMAKRAEDRFASYDELIAELERISPARTAPAGFAVRTIAAGIDLAGCAALTGVLTLSAGWGARYVAFGAIVLVYTTIALARWGQTVGRALLEIEVVSVETGGPPRLRDAFVRTLLELGPPALATGTARPHEGLGFVMPLAGGVWIGATVLAAIAVVALASWRRPDRRTFWDRGAGTMVRYRRGGVGASQSAV